MVISRNRNPYAEHFNRYVDSCLREARRHPDNDDILGPRCHRLPKLGKNNPFNPPPDPSFLPAAESDYITYQIECYTAPPGPLVPRTEYRRRPIRPTPALLWRREKRRLWDTLAVIHCLLGAASALLWCFASEAWALLQTQCVRLAPYVNAAWAGTCALRTVLFDILLPRIGALYVLLWLVGAVTGLRITIGGGGGPAYVLVPESRMWSGPFDFEVL
ncbi:hypothetical protein SODALDRAFT_42511 [Sodiomyces alkalinus F11]|uniref:Uncharacterized protein n=1 Tax=Sodiomyces alkalinus (strain CBS 110278 / VKM F-3762 / F11) TaxID=1314773 RepID=A0A3N2QA82_SODAK|nr:hypothetical protein SODALDRAFT_42511 [Sodiomyces alkalinus F11]ROT43578.1 hypothetical protein SODALDRAFT_42511 [Sodiomyces alkalinus F11]